MVLIMLYAILPDGAPRGLPGSLPGSQAPFSPDYHNLFCSPHYISSNLDRIHTGDLIESVKR
jgi:hypothetical protein